MILLYQRTARQVGFNLLMLTGELPGKLFFWQVQPEIHSFRLHSDGPAEDDDVEDGVPGFVECELPNR